MEYNRAWKMRSLFDYRQKHLQASLKPKSNQATDENSRAKALFKFCFQCGSKFVCSYDFNMSMGKKGST